MKKITAPLSSQRRGAALVFIYVMRLIWIDEMIMRF